MKINKKIVACLICGVSLFIFAIAAWSGRYFGRVYPDQVLATLMFGHDGVFTADPIFITRFVHWCLLWPAVLTLGYALLIFVLGRSSRPFIVRAASSFIFPVVLLFVAFASVFHEFHLWDMVKRSVVSHADYFETHYINPNQMTFQSRHPKSLILIYMESVENTYSDTKTFGRDLLKPLHEEAKKNISFANYQQMPGTGWTMAAIVSTQCGVPLKTLTLFGNMNALGQTLTVFLPKAKCLGDILAEQGYTNVFMNGSSLEFSGKGTFLRNHHYQEVYGKEEWVERGVLQGEEDLNGWGLSDERMFEQAKLKLTSLMKSNKPFNLTLLTVDTHGPNGYVNKACYKKGYRHFDGIVACTAEEVEDFVDFVKEHGWLDRVNIVILGDHLAMQNPVSNKLEAHKYRTIFNEIITRQSIAKNTNTIVHFDIFPTLVDLLGIHYEGSQLGLGYSAIAPKDVKPSDRMAVMEANIALYSKTYNQLWTL